MKAAEEATNKQRTLEQLLSTADARVDELRRDVSRLQHDSYLSNVRLLDQVVREMVATAKRVYDEHKQKICSQ
jgi:Mn-dependent DtxR family transcriptional regulator